MSAKYTLGAYLRRGRERASLSVEAVSAGSRIVPRLVTLGNAGGVELELDGHALPALGARGQVVRDATVAGESGP